MRFSFPTDLPDPVYERILEELGDELSYAFGGCTTISTFGKYRSSSGVILPDRVNVLFTDTPFHWDEDRRVIERHLQGLRDAVGQALVREEAILVAAHPIFHLE